MFWIQADEIKTPFTNSGQNDGGFQLTKKTGSCRFRITEEANTDKKGKVGQPKLPNQRKKNRVQMAFPRRGFNFFNHDNRCSCHYGACRCSGHHRIYHLHVCRHHSVLHHGDRPGFLVVKGSRESCVLQDRYHLRRR